MIGQPVYQKSTIRVNTVVSSGIRLAFIRSFYTSGKASAADLLKLTTVRESQISFLIPGNDDENPYTFYNLATQAYFPLHFSSQQNQDGKLQTCRTKIYIFVLTLFLVSFSFVCPRETLEKKLEEIKQHWNYVVVSHYFKSCCMRIYM